MSIEVKCNSCSTKYNVSDKFAGGSVKCSKCHSPIHVPIVPRRPPLAPAANAAEAAELAFDYAPNLAKAAATITAPAPAPAGPAAVPFSSSDAPRVEDSAIESPAVPAERRRPWRFSLAWLKRPAKRSKDSIAAAPPMFDFRVKSYRTGALARLLWGLYVCGAGYLVFLEIRQLLSLGNLPPELRQFALWTSMAHLVGIAALLVVVRIALETVSVLFDIATTLREVRDELRKRTNR